MGIDWKPFWQMIEDKERVVLSSHVRPDADALGSELALAELLTRIGKQVSIVNPTAAPSGLDFLDPDGLARKLGNGISAEDVQSADVHIVVDTSAWSQLADVGRVLRRSEARKCVIDHHVSSDDLGAVCFKDTSSAATGLLILDLIESRSHEISSTMASSLFCAIATDTGWFRFPSTNAATMSAISRLIECGANPARLYFELYERRSLSRVKLASRVLDRIQVESNGQLAFTFVTREDFKSTGTTPLDTEDLVNECLRIDGVQAAFIAVELEGRRIKFSLRGREPMNVASVAEGFGGGGHRLAAGAQLPGPLDDAIEQVCGRMVQMLHERLFQECPPATLE